ncbi:MAG: hypothetical protein Q7T55_04180 [Solirubrobacteraceae bacterium]|nr:hypothetical protein [Solirubrobacteraceae bacterium]
MWDGVPGYGYLTHPTDQLGVPGSEAGGIVTPEGAIFTPSVEVTPWLGAKTIGVAKRRGLPDPKVPLFATSAGSKGTLGTAAWWAADIAGAPSAVMALAPNRKREFGVALKWGGPSKAGGRLPSYRFVRPAVPVRSGLYSQPGEPFAPGRCWQVKRRGGGYVVTRGKSVVALIVGSARRVSAKLPGARTNGCTNSAKQLAIALRLRVSPKSAIGHVVVPFLPLATNDPRVGAILAADVRATGLTMADAFRAQRNAGSVISLPEAAVQKALDASITNMMVPRYQLPDGQWVQTVNTAQYHSFWLRDAASISNALDLVGMHGLAAQNLAYYTTWQTPEGEFNSRIGQRDGHGQALWSLGQHVRLTGDVAFATGWLPSVVRALDWTAAAMAASPQGILPPSDPGDNELLAGLVTGDQLWAVAGLDAAVTIATVAGDRATQRRATQLRDTLRERVVALMRSTALGNRIRPVLDQLGGYSWGELWAAWPYPSLSPTDPLVQSTMTASVSEQKEGIGTYSAGAFLHTYTGFRVWQTQLRAGDQVQPLDGLYSTLTHLTSTGGGFETYLRPYGKRDTSTNLAPHGWLASELTTLIHDLLVRDQDDELVLLGALPAAWLVPGAVTSAQRLETAQGSIDLRFEATETGGVLSWSLTPRARTPKMRWTLPTTIDGASVVGDGTLANREVTLTKPVGSLTITWRRDAAPGPSLAATLQRLQDEYKTRGLTPPE